jgi:hypothetical protein
MSNQLVSDADVEKALDWLRDAADEIGTAKQDAYFTDGLVKHVKALEMKKHNELPVSAQEREALASQAFKEALLDAAVAAGEYEKLRSLREAAAAKIEAWRSASANYRSMKIG